MRIAIFCPSFGQVGGIERKAELLIAAFRDAGHEVSVIARGAAASGAGDGPVPILRLPHRQLPRRATHVAHRLRFLARLPGAIRGLRRAVATARADVILTLAIPSYAPYMIGLAGTAPLVFSLEIGGPGMRQHPRIMRWALRRAARVVACASPLARTAVALAPEIAARVVVIPNGVDPEPFGPGPAYAHPRRYVLTVARLSPQKGIDVLLEAFASLGPGAGELDLLIAGDGPERPALLARRSRLRLDARVHFLGELDAGSLPALYRGAALVACPSRWEGLPLVCLEAMASGRAVVASAVDGTPDAVLDGETGVLVPPEDAGALARAIESVLRTPGRAERLGARGAAVVRERFAWSRVTERYLAVLAEAASGAR